MTSKEIKVFIKVRPLITREKNENLTSLWQISQNTISSIDKQYHMTFGKPSLSILDADHVIDHDQDQIKTENLRFYREFYFRHFREFLGIESS